MSHQTGRNILVAYKEENTFGTPEAGTGGTVFRPNSGKLELAKAAIESNENRRDGLKTRGRHGSKSVSGNYSGDLSLGSYDDFIEAVFRGTFSAAITITEATAAMSSATLSVTAGSIVASAGSWLTAGLRVGEVIRLGSGFVSANQDRNIRITGLTATTISVAETLTAEAGPLASYSLTRPKTLLQGTTPRSFTVEETEIDIDSSEVFSGCRIGQMQLQMQPNGMATVDFGIVGQDMDIKTGVDSPSLTDPVASTSIGVTAVEAVIRLGTTDLLDVSALNLSIYLNASGNPVVGSSLTPDVFTNQAMVEGSITALRQDVSKVQNFLNEDQLSLHILFTENESEPKDFCSFYVGNLTLASASKSELGQDGPRTQDLTLMIGVDERGGAFDATSVKYQTSAV